MPVALCGFETWSVLLRAERRLRVFECLVLREVSGVKRGKWQKAEEDCMMICAAHEGDQMERSETAGCMERKGTGLC